MDKNKKNRLAFLLLTAIFMVTMVMAPGRAMAQPKPQVVKVGFGKNLKKMIKKRRARKREERRAVQSAVQIERKLRQERMLEQLIIQSVDQHFKGNNDTKPKIQPY